MVMPALGLAYLIAAPAPISRRLLHLSGALAVLVVAAGWFVVLTVLWPASSRPYIAGSTDNNFMNLVLGYNGFARVLGRNHPGDTAGFVGGRDVIGTAATDRLSSGVPAHGGFGGQTQGLPRLFSGEFGFEIGWLIPAALLAIVLVSVARGRAPRTDRVRAGVILFGGWMVVDGLVLSFMHGTIHPYYCLSLAPAVAGMFAIGVHEMWRTRASWSGRFGLAAMILAAGVPGWWILDRNSDWYPALRWTILALTGSAAVAVLIATWLPARRWVSATALTAGLIGAIAAPSAYTIATIGHSHRGGGPTVGPGEPDGHGAAMFGQHADNPELDAMLAATDTDWSAAISGSSSAAGLELSTGTAVMAIGGFSGSDPTPTLPQFIDDVTSHRVAYYILPNAHADHTSGGGAGGPNAGPHSAFDKRGHADIEDWVSTHFTPVTVGTATVYDLSGGHKACRRGRSNHHHHRRKRR